MTIEQLIAHAQAALVNISQLRNSAERLGDVQQIARLDAEAAQTQITLNKLLSLQS
jgi:hypothetical protein